MTRTAMTALVMMAMLGCLGCPLPDDSLTGPRVHADTSKGLTVELVLPKYSFYRGEAIPLKVVARNDSRRSILLDADSRALAYVTLHRRAIDAWQRIKKYPDSAIMVTRHWTLRPGESRTFPLNVDVAPDWPTGESLRLVGGLNGRPDVAPAAMIDVYPTRDAYERASGLKDD